MNLRLFFERYGSVFFLVIALLIVFVPIIIYAILSNRAYIKKRKEEWLGKSLTNLLSEFGKPDEKYTRNGQLILKYITLGEKRYTTYKVNEYRTETQVTQSKYIDIFILENEIIVDFKYKVR